MCLNCGKRVMFFSLLLHFQPFSYWENQNRILLFFALFCFGEMHVCCPPRSFRNCTALISPKSQKCTQVDLGKGKKSRIIGVHSLHKGRHLCRRYFRNARKNCTEHRSPILLFLPFPTYGNRGISSPSFFQVGATSVPFPSFFLQW